MKKFTVSCAFIVTALLFTVRAQTYQNSVEKNLSELVSQKKITKNDAATWMVTSENTSSISGVQNVYFRQALNGLEIYGTESSIHVLPNGKVLKSFNNFVKDVAQKTSIGIVPTKTPVQAVQIAANHLGYSVHESLTEVSRKNSLSQETLVSKGGISLSEIPVKLMYQKLSNETIALVWDLSIQSNSKSEWYSVRVNANSGEIIDKVNWVNSCYFDPAHYEENHDHSTVYGPMNNMANTNSLLLTGSYEVFAVPLESPLYGRRSIETNAVNTTASPFGWHDTNGSAGAEYTVTRGNNVNAFKYGGPNHGYQTDGGTSLVFHHPFDTNYSSSNTSLDASLTNLFYWNNVIHDIFYQYGFDEESGNFQQNNYGNGGLENDAVQAQNQMGPDCGAFFGTPPDGTSGYMEMNTCNDKDSSFDNLVIVHEYAHGLSTRLTGGPANSNCLWQGEAMSEGWSDWYGLMLTMDADDEATDSRGIGTYVFGLPAGGPGIRPYPYTTDMTINPYTYDDIREVTQSGIIWGAMLWEMTWLLIDEYGFDDDLYNGGGGNNIALALVTEGLRLQPCDPGYIDGRDAILAADLALYGGANQCIIWAAFAKRGLGVSADQGSSLNIDDGIEAFDTPTDLTVVICPEDIEVSIPEGTMYLVPDFVENGDISAVTSCSDNELTIVQTPAKDTQLGAGTHIVEIEITDEYNNTFNCSFELLIDEFLGVNEYLLNANSVKLYPNPTDDKVTIVNNSSIKINTATVINANGRLIEKFDFKKNNGQITVSLKSLPSGVYFIKLNSDTEEIIKSVIKK